MHQSPKSSARVLPEAKVAAGTGAGGGTALVLWIADYLGADMPQAVAGAVVALVVAVAGWLAPHTTRDDIPEG